MQPTSDVISQLFSHVPLTSVRLFSCGHVIPKENMLCVAVSSGPTGVHLALNFENRSKIAVMDEIGRSVVNICKCVPGGVVVFFQSYSYEEALVKRWKRRGILQSIEQRKKLFREKKAGKATEHMLDEYSEHCLTPKGAVLFSVVGGKLSEGINFKDHLARAVVMVGLPFPNRADPELKVRLKYLDNGTNNFSGKEYYENLCMKAVNQCIGRSIRHQKDYASVILLDARYKRPSIASKLPRWIAQDMKTPTKFGPVFKELHAYFKRKKE